MFVKLNKQFDDITFCKGNEVVAYGGIISYSDVNNVNLDLFKVIPERYRSAFSLSIMDIIGEVPPHTDSDVKTVINFYLKCGEYKTIFFNGESDYYQVENQTDGKVFNRDELVESDSFVAKSGDAFCLDVKRIHAVDSINGKQELRSAVCLSTFDYDFEQVSNMLSDSGYIS
jgi:hypothetical protein